MWVGEYLRGQSAALRSHRSFQPEKTGDMAGEPVRQTAARNIEPPGTKRGRRMIPQTCTPVSHKKRERAGACDLFERHDYPRDQRSPGATGHLKDQSAPKVQDLAVPDPTIRRSRSVPAHMGPDQTRPRFAPLIRSDPKGPDQTVVGGMFLRPFGQSSTSHFNTFCTLRLSTIASPACSWACRSRAS